MRWVPVPLSSTSPRSEQASASRISDPVASTMTILRTVADPPWRSKIVWFARPSESPASDLGLQGLVPLGRLSVGLEAQACVEAQGIVLVLRIHIQLG